MPFAQFILIAEDDDDDRLLLEEAFEVAGCTTPIAFANDGIELLARLGESDRRHRPLIVLDLNMPRMNGREVLRALRADPVHRKTPIVVLSTSTAPTDIDDAYALGANSFFPKPLGFDRLVETVRVLVDYWSRFALLPSPNPRDASDLCEELAGDDESLNLARPFVDRRDADVA